MIPNGYTPESNQPVQPKPIDKEKPASLEAQKPSAAKDSADHVRSAISENFLWFEETNAPENAKKSSKKDKELASISKDALQATGETNQKEPISNFFDKIFNAIKHPKTTFKSIFFKEQFQEQREIKHGKRELKSLKQEYMHAKTPEEFSNLIAKSKQLMEKLQDKDPTLEASVHAFSCEVEQTERFVLEKAAKASLAKASTSPVEDTLSEQIKAFNTELEEISKRPFQDDEKLKRFSQDLQYLEDYIGTLSEVPEAVQKEISHLKEKMAHLDLKESQPFGDIDNPNYLNNLAAEMDKKTSTPQPSTTQVAQQVNSIMNNIVGVTTPKAPVGIAKPVAEPVVHSSSKEKIQQTVSDLKMTEPSFFQKNIEGIRKGIQNIKQRIQIRPQETHSQALKEARRKIENSLGGKIDAESSFTDKVSYLKALFKVAKDIPVEDQLAELNRLVPGQFEYWDTTELAIRPSPLSREPERISVPFDLIKAVINLRE